VIGIVTLAFLPPAAVVWGSAALGATVAYHATSTWLETHKRQTDLLKVGLPFAWCFLPGANALLYGALIGTATGVGAGGYFARVMVREMALARLVRGWL
jgi:hypothetical protein